MARKTKRNAKVHEPTAHDRAVEMGILLPALLSEGGVSLDKKITRTSKRMTKEFQKMVGAALGELIEDHRIIVIQAKAKNRIDGRRGD